MMLPPPNYSAAFDNPDDDQGQALLFRQTRAVSTKNLNVHMLTKVCGLAIHWVDSLPCHLELDKQSGKLFLYRYPSFCLSALGHSRAHESNKEGKASVLHRCALPEPEPSSIPWATEEDVDGILREVLLSYRLIFGQITQLLGVLKRSVPPSFESRPRR